MSANRFDEVRTLVRDIEKNMDSFYEKANKAAGTRARKGLLTLRKLCQELRFKIQKDKNES